MPATFTVRFRRSDEPASLMSRVSAASRRNGTGGMEAGSYARIGSGESSLTCLSSHLLVDPVVRLSQSVFQTYAGRPAKPFANQAIVTATPANTLRRVERVAPRQREPGDALHDVYELVDGHHLIAADIQRLIDLTRHQAQCSFKTVIDEGEAARLSSVAPDVDRARTGELGLNHLAADGCRGFLAATVVCAIRAVDVVIAGHASGESEILLEMTAEPLAEQLLPAVAVLRHRRVGV